MPVNGSIQLAYEDTAWFAANPTIVLLEGQHVYLSDGTDEFLSAYVVGDGVNELQDLPWKGLVDTTLDIANLIRQEFNYTTGAQTFTLTETASAAYAVFVNGQELNENQYTVSGTTLTILDTLLTGWKVNIIYSTVSIGINPSYTKLEVDDLLAQVDANALLYAMSF